MQEIAILLSSLAGVATAAAVRKVPKNKTQLLSLGASSHIKSQINALNIEKDILTKTITRLYQSDSELTKIQKDRLLLKYQHQLGIVLAKLEKLEAASHHPDLGPIGDGLITLMDQKLSSLDDRLYELSSKIIANTPDVKESKENKIERQEKRAESKKQIFDFVKPKESKSEPIIIPPVKSQGEFELTTLTRIPRTSPKFPLFEEKISQPKQVVIKEETIQPKIEKKIEIVQVVPKSEQVVVTPDISKEVAKLSEHKALPSPPELQSTQRPATKIQDDDFDEDDTDDLDKIKGEIMKALSKLEQAEVE